MLKPTPSLIILLVLFKLSLWGQYSNADQYISQYRGLAIREMNRTGIPASIKMAQAILESAAGTSTLATKANNHFGIKCGNVWNGDNYGLRDDERMLLFFKKKSCFRKYNNPEESFLDHSEFIKRPNSPYQDLFSLDKSDYKGWAYGLKKAGYATAGDYPEKLISIIEKYHLYQLDGLSQEDVIASKPSTVPVEITKPIEPQDRIIRINQVKAIAAKAGETPVSIGKATNTSISSILEYNDHIQYANQVLNANDIVFLQKKKKSYWGKEKTHTVTNGDNMFNLSQQYGVRLDKLYENNNMSPETEPAIGQVIYLRGDRPSNEPVKLRAKNDTPVNSNINSEPVVTNSKPVLSTSTEESTTNPKQNITSVSGTISSKSSEESRPKAKFISTPIASAPVNSGTSDKLDFEIEPTERIENESQQVKEEIRFKPALVGTSIKPPVYNENKEKPDSNPNINDYHTVTTGDTLYNISKRYDVTVATLKQLNNISDNNINLGQKLRIK